MTAPRHFFITGTPRSRTSWFANWLTWGNAFCHHDLLGKVDSLAQFREEMSGAEFVGDSDTGLVFLAPWLQEQFPKARWVVLDREPDAAASDLIHFARDTAWADKFLPQGVSPVEALNQLSNSIALCQDAGRRISGALRVPFAALEREETHRAIWAHCLPGVPFPERRYRLVDRQLINPHPDKVRCGVSASLRMEIANLNQT